MPYSKIQVWSLASVLIGNGPQQDESEDNTFNNAAREVYDILVETRLTSERWGFTRKKVELSRLPDKPLNQWRSAHQIPAEALAIYRVSPDVAYGISGDLILSNATKLEADYLYRPIEDAWPAYFATAIATELAAMVCFQVTNNAGLTQALAQKSIGEWQNAWKTDAMQRTVEEVVDQPLINVRGIGGGVG